MNVIFSKYNSKGSSSSGSISSFTGGSSTSNNSEFQQVTTSGLNRILWGNSDDGEDLNESMWVNGNIHIGEWNIEYEEDEDGDLDEETPILPKEEEDAGTGNLYVAGKGQFKEAEYSKGYNLPEDDSSTKFASTEWVKNKIKDHKTLTFKDSKNTNLGTFDNTVDKTITIKNYDDEISNLGNRVTNNEGEISDIWDEISDLQGSLGDVAGEIPNIYSLTLSEGSFSGATYNPTSSAVTVKIPVKTSHLVNDSGFITSDDIPTLDDSNPIILFSGIITSNNGDTSSTNWRPFSVSSTSVYHSGISGLTINYATSDKTHPTLKINILNKSRWSIKPCSIQAMVIQTTDYNPSTVQNDQNRRSQGYWTTGGIMTDGNIYLNVWRLGDSNNDCTYADQVAWRVTRMSLTIFGTAQQF